ncbi:carboxypeptidase-like regulatory domain-containing protein [Hymenobacter sp. BRD67]|uniref:carboxypeptidase-like regulatory domain-containing protein n=1 Tax=Hymenobacter sp. BRD67 TaxID=2675877 RepID=UPI001564348E|nr:carboxypeptidase-like regulatory domain-containing protein [Hymenobacter sp. BRD67]QKG55074.1 carboxypeptidase-like regulatory domain-containing protein [Hymenobacter sp. BRD67]
MVNGAAAEQRQRSRGPKPLRVLVRDARTHAPVPGVTVAIPDLKTGAATDASGQATVSDVPAGTYQVQFSSLGYEAKCGPLLCPRPASRPPWWKWSRAAWNWKVS